MGAVPNAGLRTREFVFAAALLLSCVPGIAGGDLAAAENAPSAGSAATSRFDGNLHLKSAGGQDKALHVVIKEWHVEKGRTASMDTGATNLLVHLRAGALIVSIDGKPQLADPAQYWTVPPGVRITLHAGLRGANFETTAVAND